MRALLCGVLCLAAAMPLVADDTLTYQANPSPINLNGYVVFYNGTGPLSYANATPADVPFSASHIHRVSAESCVQGLTLPFSANLKAQSGSVSGAYGDSGYEKVLQKLKKQEPAMEGLYDLQVDQHDIRILTIYLRHCTDISGLAFQ